jgi:tetratricopeptide (TPR) repeat protein
MAETFNDLGMIYRDLGNEQQLNSFKDEAYFVKAIHYLTEAVNMIESIPNQNKNKVRYLNNLGEAYRMLNDLEKAECNIKRGLELAQTEWGNQKHRLISSTYFNLGNVYIDKQEYQAAKLCFEKAVEISSDEEVAGKNHPLLARHMSALGVAWQLLGRNKEACNQFQAAHSILKSTNRGQKQLKQLVEKQISSCDSTK